VGQLYQNIYDNPSRVVTGVVTIFPDDVQILCDSTGGVITINLCEIPALKWNVNYKLYIVDSTNTAGANAITINAAIGQTINGGSSIVINTNGGACLIQVGSNTTYIATFYPLPTTPAAPIAVADALGTITATTSKITFTNAVVTSTSPTEAEVTTVGVSAITALSPLTGGTITTSGNIGFQDTGWVNCDGFEHMAGSSARPQFRIYGKQVFLRGVAVVPMANLGVYIPLTTSGASGWYVNDSGNPFTGTTGLINGVTSLSAGSFTFNLGSDIIPSTYNPLSQTYTETYSQFVVGYRPVITSESNTYNFLTGMYVIRFGKGSLSTLRIDSIREYETGQGDTMPSINSLDGTSNLRRIVGEVSNGQYLARYKGMINFSNNSSSIVNTSFVQDYTIFTEPISGNNPTFTQSIDSSRFSDMGGFQFVLDGITSFLD
jgi:hypothetical protein